jgi:hypothetical protein
VKEGIDHEHCQECGGKLLCDFERGEKVCLNPQCARVIWEHLEDQNQTNPKYDDYTTVRHHETGTVGTQFTKIDLSQLALKGLAGWHDAQQKLDSDIRLLEAKADRMITHHDRYKKQDIFFFIGQRMKIQWNLDNAVAKKIAQRRGREFDFISIRKEIKKSILEQAFDVNDVPYCFKINRRKKQPTNTENMSDFEVKWWRAQQKKRGRKKGQTFTNYDGKEYYGICKKCGNELLESETVADHMKKYHPEAKNIQNGYNWFKKRSKGSRTDLIIQCPTLACDMKGSLHRRSNGYYYFEHDSNKSQHYIPKNMAELVISKRQRELKELKESKKRK